MVSARPDMASTPKRSTSAVSSATAHRVTSLINPAFNAPVTSSANTTNHVSRPVSVATMSTSMSTVQSTNDAHGSGLTLKPESGSPSPTAASSPPSSSTSPPSLNSPKLLRQFSGFQRNLSDSIRSAASGGTASVSSADLSSVVMDTLEEIESVSLRSGLSPHFPLLNIRKLGWGVSNLRESRFLCIFS